MLMNAQMQFELKFTSRINRQLASLLGNRMACRLTPKLSNTTSSNTTKYIMFFTIFPIIVTRGPAKRTQQYFYLLQFPLMT